MTKMLKAAPVLSYARTGAAVSISSETLRDLINLLMSPVLQDIPVEMENQTELYVQWKKSYRITEIGILLSSLITLLHC